MTGEVEPRAAMCAKFEVASSPAIAPAPRPCNPAANLYVRAFP